VQIGSGPPDSENVTRLLRASSEGSVDARDALLRLVHEELRGMARSRLRGERRDHTLGATALVHEAYLKLFRASAINMPEAVWENRGAFFAAAATAMRRILIDHARARAVAKRGGTGAGRARIPLDVVEAASTADPDHLIALDEAIAQLEGIDTRAAEVVRLRFFGGLELVEIAEVLAVSDRTVKRDWQFARAWLHEAVRDAGE